MTREFLKHILLAVLGQGMIILYLKQAGSGQAPNTWVYLAGVGVIYALAYGPKLIKRWW